MKLTVIVVMQYIHILDKAGRSIEKQLKERLYCIDKKIKTTGLEEYCIESEHSFTEN